MGPLNPRLGAGGQIRPPALRRPRGSHGPRTLPGSEIGRLRRLLRRALLGLTAATLAALLVWGVSALPDPEAPPGPAAPVASAPSTPEVPKPNLSPPPISAPSDLDFSAPSVGGPDLDGSDTNTETTPTPPQTYRRYINLHVHEWSLWWHWQVPWWPLAAAALALALVAGRRLIGRTLPRRIASLMVAATAACAIWAWEQAVVVPDSSGQPVRFKALRSETKPLGGDREIVTTREARHRHLPIEIQIHWLLAGAGAGVLAVRQQAAWRRRRRHIRDTNRRST